MSLSSFHSASCVKSRQFIYRCDIIAQQDNNPDHVDYFRIYTDASFPPEILGIWQKLSWKHHLIGLILFI